MIYPNIFLVMQHLISLTDQSPHRYRMYFMLFVVVEITTMIAIIYGIGRAICYVMLCYVMLCN